MKGTRIFSALAGLLMSFSASSCGPGQGPAREEIVRESLRQQDDQEANARLRRLKMHVAESMPKPDSLSTDTTALVPAPTPVQVPAPAQAPVRTTTPAPAPARTTVPAPARTTTPAATPAPAPVSPPDSTETN